MSTPFEFLVWTYKKKNRQIILFERKNQNFYKFSACADKYNFNEECKKR